MRNVLNIMNQSIYPCLQKKGKESKTEACSIKIQIGYIYKLAKAKNIKEDDKSAW